MTAGVASTRAGLFVQRLACGAATPGLRRRQEAKQLLQRLCDRFSAARARNVRAVVEFRVETGDGGVERRRLMIDRGRCAVVRRPVAPTATIAIALEDLQALVDGRVEATPLFMSQRMKVWGDVLLAVRLPDFFPA